LNESRGRLRLYLWVCAQLKRQLFTISCASAGYLRRLRIYATMAFT